MPGEERTVGRLLARMDALGAELEAEQATELPVRAALSLVWDPASIVNPVPYLPRVPLFGPAPGPPPDLALELPPVTFEGEPATPGIGPPSH